MEKGNKPFSVTYVVSYALSNSHHSVDYLKEEYIEIDKIFFDIGKIEETKFCELTPLTDSWAIDLAKNKRYYGQKPIISKKNNTLVIEENPSTREFSTTGIIPKESTSTVDLQNLSERIDTIGLQLARLTG